MRRDTLLAALVVLGAVLGPVPATASGMVAGEGGTVGMHGTAVAFAGVASAPAPSNETRNDSTANDSMANVSTGQLLSTVVAVTETEVESTVEERAFSIAAGTGNESERAALISDRAAELRERVVVINEAYRTATAAYEAGELTTAEYAQRLAVLNARARSVRDGYRQLQRAARNVSALALRVAGYRQANTSAAIAALDRVSGVGTNALLKRFTGETEGTVAVETKHGLTVVVETKHDGHSRAFERPHDADRSFAVSQVAALSTARGVLSEVEGNWTLVGSSINRGHGTYRFEFRLDADTAGGEATVTVDGSSGAVVALEERVGGPTGRHADRGAAGTAGSLTLLVADRPPRLDATRSNATVTLRALAGGTPVEGVQIRMNGELVGTTGPNGTVTVTLPTSGDVVLTAVHDGSKAALTFESVGDGRAEIRRGLNVTGTVDDGSVTVSVTYDGEPVTGATVYVNGERVGTTGSDGTLTFPANATGVIELTLVEGAFEATLTLTATGDGLVLSESDVNGTDRGNATGFHGPASDEHPGEHEANEAGVNRSAADEQGSAGSRSADRSPAGDRTTNQSALGNQTVTGNQTTTTNQTESATASDSSSRESTLATEADPDRVTSASDDPPGGIEISPANETTTNHGDD